MGTLKNSGKDQMEGLGCPATSWVTQPHPSLPTGTLQFPLPAPLPYPCPVLEGGSPALAPTGVPVSAPLQPPSLPPPLSTKSRGLVCFGSFSAACSSDLWSQEKS